MNNIEILEEKIKNVKKYNTYSYGWTEQDIEAIENLIKENKELKKQANELVEQYEKELTEKNNYIFNLENEREALHKIIDKEFE